MTLAPATPGTIIDDFRSVQLAQLPYVRKPEPTTNETNPLPTEVLSDKQTLIRNYWACGCVNSFSPGDNLSRRL